MAPNPQHWQPTTFIRVVKSLRTATDTVLIMTDQGEGYIKALGNHGSPQYMACELVATELARWFGLRTLIYAIMEVSEDNEITLKRGGNAQPGPAFITQHEDNDPWGGSAEELIQVENMQDITRLVIFDTWTLNCDRYPPNPESRKPNLDNVFLSKKGAPRGKVILKSMDHTHCFTCGEPLNSTTGRIARVQDDRPYGIFPGFVPYWSALDAREALAKLRTIERDAVTAIIERIPSEWEVDQESRQSLIDLICRRAIYMSDNSEAIINTIESRFESALNTD